PRPGRGTRAAGAACGAAGPPCVFDGRSSRRRSYAAPCPARAGPGGRRPGGGAVDGVPSVAAWRHLDAREAFEGAFFSPSPSGLRIDGHTAAVEEGEPFAARYAIQLDRDWRTVRAHLWGRSASGAYERRLEADGRGGWRIDGMAAPALDGLWDIDLEASA